MTNEILESMEFVPDGGALMYRGLRYMLIRPETFMWIQKSVISKVGEETASQIFYDVGQKAGNMLVTYFCHEMEMDPVDTIRYLARLGAQLGWGRVEIESLDPLHGTLEIEVSHSVFAEEHSFSGEPVCHMIRGVFAGAWSRVLDYTVNGIEMRCRAVEGPGPCRFVFAKGSLDSTEANLNVK
ncbi:XylR N-terminal domain-containing protein [bacterium]|nr:XylR N-terminal domain-containing protein [bacterium]MBU1651924.1 XylR N-terminal domain-containing protein [bacterium]